MCYTMYPVIPKKVEQGPEELVTCLQGLSQILLAKPAQQGVTKWTLGHCGNQSSTLATDKSQYCQYIRLFRQHISDSLVQLVPLSGWSTITAMNHRLDDISETILKTTNKLYICRPDLP